MNNRQSGRRRGRNNNQRPQGGNQRGGGDSGNRIDSRARGNAAQLLEKYKNLAREAQMSGDRVQTEYYLQFADHYFRVLADSRSRQEEQRASRGDDRYDDERADIDERTPFGFGEEGEPGDPSDFDIEVDTRRRPDEQREQRRDRNDGRDRPDRGERRERFGRNDGRGDGRHERADDDARAPRRESGDPQAFGDGERDEPAVTAERRPARARRRPADADTGSAGIDAAVLPPAIGASSAASEEAAPTRRRLRPRKTEAEQADVAADD